MPGVRSSFILAGDSTPAPVAAGVYVIMPPPSSNPPRAGQRKRSAAFLDRVQNPFKHQKLTDYVTPVETPAEVGLFLRLYPQYSSDFKTFATVFNSSCNFIANGPHQPKKSSHVCYKTPELLKKFEQECLRKCNMERALSLAAATPLAPQAAAEPVDQPPTDAVNKLMAIYELQSADARRRKDVEQLVRSMERLPVVQQNFEVSPSMHILR